METTTQDNRKRAMDAIDRRCALEKAEQLKQQRKKEVGPKRESGREVSKPSEHLTVARGTKSSLVSASKDAQADDLAYVMLSHPVHKNLLEAPTEVSKEKGTRVDRFMHELLQKGDSAKKYMQSFRSKKFNDVILLDNYVKRRSGFVGSRLRALQTHSKRSKVHMSMKEHKKCGTFDLSQDLCQFHHFVPMHEMWKSYMIELFKSRKGDPLDKSLLTADLHGAIIHVADCKWCQRGIPSSYSKLIAGKSRYLEKNSLEETQACDREVLVAAVQEAHV
ncbi:uncharacterized protein LOC116215503 isoform X3 [Punica granatum]|uniref:Uncharacterized protein LOC116215503 isoform X3 n=1 Tax=Punica granatum TaxID=22663 RepID=A0A6P8EL69_PUNGR|nr:uncharacterized protein LOC116215503 isoform X3 [Punica granatum]